MHMSYVCMVDILQISSEPSIQPTPIQEQNACVCVGVCVWSDEEERRAGFNTRGNWQQQNR